MDFILLTQASPGSSGFSMLIPMAVIFLIFWLLVIRPQSKAQKELQAKIDGMKRGDMVRTRGGLIGQVAKVEEAEVTLKIDLERKVRVKVARSAIEDVQSGGETKGDE